MIHIPAHTAQAEAPVGKDTTLTHTKAWRAARTAAKSIKRPRCPRRIFAVEKFQNCSSSTSPLFNKRLGCIPFTIPKNGGKML